MYTAPDPRLWQWTNDHPDTTKWLERIRQLDGEYGRPAGVRTFGQIMGTVWVLMTGAMVLFLWRVMVRTHAPETMRLAVIAFVLLFVIWAATIWRRLDLRYVLRDGTLSALGTYRNVMWTEQLAGLQEIRYVRLRAAVQLTLVWPDRQREILGIPSLLHALDD